MQKVAFVRYAMAVYSENNAIYGQLKSGLCYGSPTRSQEVPIIIYERGQIIIVEPINWINAYKWFSS